jgi:hypothetical protein
MTNEDSDSDSDEDSWADYWPPSPPSSDDEDYEEEETSSKPEEDRIDEDTDTIEYAVQPAVEPKGAPMNNTIPAMDGVGFKSQNCIHGAA